MDNRYRRWGVFESGHQKIKGEDVLTGGANEGINYYSTFWLISEAVGLF